MTQRLTFDPPRPTFDVLVVAGDVTNGEMSLSIAIVSELAVGKPAVFVAGNYEWWFGPGTPEEKREAAHVAARQSGVDFLECDSVDICGVRFTDAMLWEPDDSRFHLQCMRLGKRTSTPSSRIFRRRRASQATSKRPPVSARR